MKPPFWEILRAFDDAAGLGARASIICWVICIMEIILS